MHILKYLHEISNVNLRRFYDTTLLEKSISELKNTDIFFESVAYKFS